MLEEQEVCGKCEVDQGEIKCSCEEIFCASCWVKHQRRLPTHRKAPPRMVGRAWNWVKGGVAYLADERQRGSQFQKDEGAKWFGLVVERYGIDRITRIIETPRFATLVEDSMHFKPNSPRRQFPSIVSFVGDTGAGKSTLIRALISLTIAKRERMEDVDAPVPGADSGSATFHPTTGEVNLYHDPSTFGTSSPRFYADCEGMLGAEPAAAQHQHRWHKNGRRYLIEEKDGKQIDRSTAVKTIYPKFLYIFSDVVCMVTRNPKSWADTAVKLLEWSAVGAQHAVNQYALPTAIIILNGPYVEDPNWVGNDLDALTAQFFKAVELEIKENAALREMAKKHEDKTMQQLFLRNFSSVHVHYVPLADYKKLGTPEIIIGQHARLFNRIKSDAENVQRSREQAWTRFDSKQMSIVFDHAFKHLASRSTEPFDFSKCRRQTDLPETTEGHIAEFLKRSLRNNIEANFSYASSVVASSLVRNALNAEGMELVYIPSVIYNNEMKQVCKRAVEDYLDNGLCCSYVHPILGDKCVNTKNGHANGHQSESGSDLGDGLFVSGEFDSMHFQEAIEKDVSSFLREINDRDTDKKERRQFATKRHLKTLRSAKDDSFWFSMPGTNSKLNGNHPFLIAKFLALFETEDRTNTCFGCLFGRPEYQLPCRHLLCLDCVQDFDQSEEGEKYPGLAIHRACPLCCDNDSSRNWPLKIRVNPRLSGVRVLSLDGGGVRGVVEIAVLQRIEKEIGLGMPLGEFFDLIVGTSAGGMIALGLGVHRWSANICMTKFNTLSRNGLNAKMFTKNFIFGWAARWLQGSMYNTDSLERALKAAFPSERLFGLRRTSTSVLQHLARVSVTTTVDSECKLFANYHSGGSKHYLNSSTKTWEAARSTSAAPMYFESYRNPAAGVECRDGGLRENNPVQIAVDESKYIWGSEVPFDLVLSIGSGSANQAPSTPISSGLVPGWLRDLFHSLLQNMDGEDAWNRFTRSAEAAVKFRARRLNVPFSANQEPALDDVASIDMMKEEAESYDFYPLQLKGHPGAIIPALHDGIVEVSLQLRASLFFFDLETISFSEDRAVAIVRGTLCCRLGPETDVLRVLTSLTEGFCIKDSFFKTPTLLNNSPFRLKVALQQDITLSDIPFRIDVKFTTGHFVTISGFPTTLKKLQEMVD